MKNKLILGMIGFTLIFTIITLATIWLSVHVSLWFCCGYCLLFILGAYAAIINDMYNQKKKRGK